MKTKSCLLIALGAVIVIGLIVAGLFSHNPLDIYLTQETLISLGISAIVIFVGGMFVISGRRK